ncbi:hypothetical protein [Devosia sp. A449]
MMMIREKRRAALMLKSALVLAAAVILVTPKEVDIPDLGSFPLITPAFAEDAAVHLSMQ